MPLAGRLIPGVLLGIAAWEAYQLWKSWDDAPMRVFAIPRGYTYHDSCTGVGPPTRWRATAAAQVCETVRTISQSSFNAMSASVPVASTPQIELMSIVAKDGVPSYYWRAHKRYLRQVGATGTSAVRTAVYLPPRDRGLPGWADPLPVPGLAEPLPIRPPIFYPGVNPAVRLLASTLPEATRVGYGVGSAAVTQPWVQPWAVPAPTWVWTLDPRRAPPAYVAAYQSTHALAAAPPRTYETKWRAPSPGGLLAMRGYSMVTEIVDALQAIYSGLPSELRKTYGREFSHMDPASQAWFLWEHRGDINWGNAAVALAGEALADTAYGIGGHVQGEMAKQMGMPVSPLSHGYVPQSYREWVQTW